jgi:hypothetical protein
VQEGNPGHLSKAKPTGLAMGEKQDSFSLLREFNQFIAMNLPIFSGRDKGEGMKEKRGKLYFPK